MNPALLFAHILCTFLLIGSYAHAQSLKQRLKSSDQQVRCDAFYELFGHGEDSKDFQDEKLHGTTTKQISDLLGKPFSTGVLEHKGVKWLRVQYLFEVCPTMTSDAEKEACKKGWRFGPALVFRNGISVPWNKWSTETGARYYSVTPEHLIFKEGGSFP